MPEKTQYATAALVRHLGGSMVVRAADQLEGDVSQPRHYGSAVVRGGTAGSTATGGGDDDRSPGLHHLTARVYPPPLDYCVGGGGAGHQLYCRATCGCDAYAATADYAGGGRRRVHDRDCSSRARTGSGDATSVYGPLKHRRHAVETTASDKPQDPRPTADGGRLGGVSDGPVARRSDDATPTTTSNSTTVSCTVPELVTDCSIASSSTRPLVNHSSS